MKKISETIESPTYHAYLKKELEIYYVSKKRRELIKEVTEVLKKVTTISFGFATIIMLLLTAYFFSL